jgi:hypothetical protein
MFAAEVKEYRIRLAKAATADATALIVMIDADTHTLQERLAQLSKTLRECGMHAIGDRERIVQLVPKRNVETWILCLNGHPVDEARDYRGKRDDWNEMIPSAAEALF